MYFSYNDLKEFKISSYYCLRKPLPLWEGRNETLSQPKADEVSQNIFFLKSTLF